MTLHSAKKTQPSMWTTVDISDWIFLTICTVDDDRSSRACRKHTHTRTHTHVSMQTQKSSISAKVSFQCYRQPTRNTHPSMRTDNADEDTKHADDVDFGYM